MISGVLRTAGMLVLVGVMSGCINSHVGKYPTQDFVLAAQLKTKNDIYAVLGLPSTIRDEGDLQVLSYQMARSKGSALGLGALGFQVEISHDWLGADALEFRVDAGGNVASVSPSIQSEGIERRLWPFGD